MGSKCGAHTVRGALLLLHTAYWVRLYSSLLVLCNQTTKQQKVFMLHVCPQTVGLFLLFLALWSLLDPARGPVLNLIAAAGTS